MKTPLFFLLPKTFAFAVFILFLQSTSVCGQTQNIYDPNANAQKELKETLQKAENENKHVLVSVGGNWCQWCLKFYHYCKNDPVLDSLIKANYIELKVNYSKENKNEAVLKQLDNPDKLGFPVFVILDKIGTRLYTQESGSLFAEGNWDREKIVGFLSKWAK